MYYLNLYVSMKLLCNDKFWVFLRLHHIKIANDRNYFKIMFECLYVYVCTLGY